MWSFASIFFGVLWEFSPSRMLPEGMQKLHSSLSGCTNDITASENMYQELLRKCSLLSHKTLHSLPFLHTFFGCAEERLTFLSHLPLKILIQFTTTLHLVNNFPKDYLKLKLTSEGNWKFAGQISNSQWLFLQFSISQITFLNQFSVLLIPSYLWSKKYVHFFIFSIFCSTFARDYLMI